VKRFELFIAGRYLRARRKEAVISVITLISVLGVAEATPFRYQPHWRGPSRFK